MFYMSSRSRGLVTSGQAKFLHVSRIVRSSAFVSVESMRRYLAMPFAAAAVCADPGVQENKANYGVWSEV